jgi:hypothetical protein
MRAIDWEQWSASLRRAYKRRQPWRRKGEVDAKFLLGLEQEDGAFYIDQGQMFNSGQKEVGA